MSQNSLDDFLNTYATPSLKSSRSMTPKKIIPMTSIQDIEYFAKQADQGVIFGAYGASDWVSGTHTAENVKRGISTVVLYGTWVTEAAFSLPEWVQQRFQRYNFFSPTKAIVFVHNTMIEIDTSRGKFSVNVNGPADQAKQLMDSLDKEFKRAENLIEWVYNERGSTIAVPLNYRPAIKSAYPWLPCALDEYIDQYLNSPASVLILIGPPGTGKTTFIKNLIHRSKADAKVTYDERVMNSDSIFASFVEEDQRFMIMEDADAFLKARTDGNTMMHRFLNVSDGLVSAAGKKLVFSTNLPSIRDIDEALLRPGRCFDVVEFRPLTRPEAQEVADEVGVELADGSSFTLAQIFGEQPSAKKGRSSRKMGFVG